MGYTGKIPAKVPLTSDDIVDGSITNADIADLAASKLTGALPAISGAALTNLATTDLSQLEMNQAILAFKIASSNQLAKFSMVDQVIDEYQDATGIDAGASTNELASGSGTAKYYEGSAVATVVASGGTVTTDGNYSIHTFGTAGGTYTSNTNDSALEYLIVAGGGGTGRGNCGGGGAGGLIATTGVSYTAGTSWTVVVGAGATVHGTNITGAQGSNSVLSGSGLTTQTAIGGGGSGTDGQIGTTGGSGGGNSYNTTATAAAGTVGQGNAGGTSSGTTPEYGGAGGGGAGAVGGTGSGPTGGNGGVGLQNDITGTNIYYAGGGGGSTNYTSSAAGNGGLGGGGHGGGNDNVTTLAEADGTDGLGAGGGGNYLGVSGGGAGGSGGDGVVIIRRLTTTSSLGGDLTLQSVSTTAESAPTSADLVVLIEDGSGTATVNTDIKGYVSRNGSAFSTAVTFVDEGDWGTNKRILVARNIDISGITTGTAMKYKLTSHNQSAGSKETRIHATSLAWA